MSEQQTPVLEKTSAGAAGTAEPAATPAQSGGVPPAAPIEQPSKPAKPPKRRRKKRIGNLIAAILAVVLLGGGGYATWYFVFREAPAEQGEILTGEVMLGSISSTVEGSGLATAKDSASLAATTTGKIVTLNVSEGDEVNEGDVLYVISTRNEEEERAKAEQERIEREQKALQERQEQEQRERQEREQREEREKRYQEQKEARDKEIAKATKEYNRLLEDLAELNDSRKDLTLTAPSNGKLTEVKTIKIGDDLTNGDVVAKLVDDTTLRLHLYYNYIYENDITVGQTAEFSIPAVMQTFPGVVEAVNKVSRIFPEGGSGFEVVLTMENPGTLTAGMDASAALTGADGAPIYPYESGKLEYNSVTELKVKIDGPLATSNLLNYAAFKTGDTILTLGDRELVKKLKDKQEEIDDAAERLAELKEPIEMEPIPTPIPTIAPIPTPTHKPEQTEFVITAPISGKVFSCALELNQEIKAGDPTVTISNTTTMSVELSVDDRNIRYVSVGQPIDLSDYEGNMYMGLVENIDLNGKSENGMTIYPVKVTVDNADGSLVNGVYLNYNFVASQSTDCLTVPVQAVNSVSDAEGNLISAVYLKADTPPENMVEMPEELLSTIPEGFYPVPVEIGLSDVTNVEIKSGLNEMDVVFLGYQRTDQMMYG